MHQICQNNNASTCCPLVLSTSLLGSDTEEEDDLFSLIEKPNQERLRKTKDVSKMDFLEEEEDEEYEQMEVVYVVQGCGSASVHCITRSCFLRFAILYLWL